MPKIITQIEIKRKKAESTDTRRPLDLAPLPRRIGRRRINPKIFVRYFDPAQYANGVERPFFYDLAFEPLGYDGSGWLPEFPGSLPSSPSSCVPWPPFTDRYGYKDSYNAYMLAGDRDDWATTYKEVKADENIQFFTSFNTDYVEGSGYPVPQYLVETEGFALSYGDGGWEQGWLEFHTQPTASTSQWQKITRTPSFDDDHFPLAVTGNCDVFLGPSPRFWEGRAVSFIEKYPTFLSGPFSRREKLFLANHFLRTVPRAALHHDDFDAWWSHIADGLVTPGGVFPSALPTSTRQFMYNLFMTLPESRSKVIDAIAWENDGLTNDPNDYATVDGFPNTYSGSGLIFDVDNWGGSTDNPRSWLDEPIVRWFKWYRPVGLLSAIIHKRDGEDAGWYYVWRTVATTIHKPYPSADFPYIADLAAADLGARV